MSNFQLYTGDSRVYPTYGMLLVTNGAVVDFAALPVPSDGRWSATSGPATVTINPSVTVPVVPQLVVTSQVYNPGTGAPTTGSYTTGELAVDSAGSEFLCTASGTPGTWVAMSGGGGGAVSSVAGRTGAVVLAESDIANLTTDLAAKAATLVATGVKTANYTAAASDLVPCDTTSAGFTVTLPTAPADKAQVAIKHVTQGSTNTVTVACGGSDVFNKTSGATSFTLPLLAQGVLLQYKASGAIWYVLADDLPLAQLDARYAMLSLTVTTILRADAQRRAENFRRDNAVSPTVYIDSVNGSDSNSGATPALAYQTIGKLTTAGVAAGARIGLARGSTFSLGGAFTFPSLTGTPSEQNRTVICAYGTGAMPIITGNIFNITGAGSLGSYIDVQDIKFTACGTGYALFVFNATTQTDVRIKRCEFGPHPGTGGIIMGVIGGLVEDCYFHDIWNSVEYPSGIGYAALFTTGTDNTIARHNTVYLCYKGLGAANTHRDLLIYRNLHVKCRVNGIDMSGGGVVGHPPKIINNFVWHNPTTPNGHGIDTQSSSVGPYWRNNIVVCDYTGTAGNVELYCIDSTSYSSTDTDYNLGWLYPGSTASYGKLGVTLYADLASFQTALAGTSYAGKEAHSLSADPLISSLVWPNGTYIPAAGSPALNAGVAVGPVSDTYLGTAPDLGAYEVG